MKKEQIVDKLKREFFEAEKPLSTLEYAIYFDYDEDVKEIADCIDMIRTHYKWYLLGINKTMNRVMCEIRRYKEHLFYEEKVIHAIIDHVEKQINDLELYELMDRHNKAKKKIFKSISI